MQHRRASIVLCLWTAALLAAAFLAGGCTDAPLADDEAGVGALAGAEAFAYQLQGFEQGAALDALAGSGYDVFVIDRVASIAGDEAFDDAALVERLHGGTGVSGAPPLVLCYLDVGQAESYRAYWEDGWSVGDPEWIAGEDPDGWDENYPVTFWAPQWADIMRSELDAIVDAGFDGAYLDWLEVYEYAPVARAAAEAGIDPEDALVSFVAGLAEHARMQDPDFVLVAQNAAVLGARPEWRAMFDGIAQEAVWFDGEGDPDTSEQVGDIAQDAELTEYYLDALAVWQDAGFPVWTVEYAADPATAEQAYERAEREGFVTYVTTRLLDRITDTPPPALD